MYELPIVLGGFAPTFPTYVPLGPGEASRLFNAIEANDLNAGNPHIGINSVTAAIRLCPGTVTFYAALLADDT